MSSTIKIYWYTLLKASIFVLAEIVNSVIVCGKTIHLCSIKKPTLTNKCDYVFFLLVARSYFIGFILLMKDQFQNIRRGHSLQQGIAIIGFISQINI